MNPQSLTDKTKSRSTLIQALTRFMITKLCACQFTSNTVTTTPTGMARASCPSEKQQKKLVQERLVSNLCHNFVVFDNYKMLVKSMADILENLLPSLTKIVLKIPLKIPSVKIQSVMNCSVIP